MLVFTSGVQANIPAASPLVLPTSHGKYSGTDSEGNSDEEEDSSDEEDDIFDGDTDWCPNSESSSSEDISS